MKKQKNIKKHIIELVIILIISAIIAIFIEEPSSIPLGFVVLASHYYIIIFIIHYIRKNKNSNNSKNKIININYDKQNKIYRNKGITYEDACKIYCKQKNKTRDQLTEEDKKIIWDYSYDDFTYFLAWIIENNYYQFYEYQYGEESREEQMNYVHQIKSRKLTPTDFLETTEGYLYIGEVSEKIRNFIMEYYNNSYTYKNENYYLKENNKIGSYLVDLQKFAKEELNSEIYGFQFKWEDYDIFKKYIDEAYKKYKTELIKDELPPISTSDMQRIHYLTQEKTKEDYEFSKKLNNINIYVFPLESNTKLLPVTDVAHKMISVLHHCLKAKQLLNTLSEEFLTSDTNKIFKYKFCDGFIFDELEKFSNYSEEQLKETSESNYYAYFYAYILGLIDKMPDNPEDCDEIKLCSLITKFNSYQELLENCKMLDKEKILYMSDYLCLEAIHYVYKNKNNIPYDEKQKNYISIQRFCSFYVLSYDFDSVQKTMEKANNIK